MPKADAGRILALESALDQKRLLRRQLKNFLHNAVPENMPIIGMCVEDTSDAEMIRELLRGTSALGVPFVLFVESKEQMPFDFYDYATVISFDSTKSKSFAGCDAVICFSKKSVEKCFAEHIVPIAIADVGCENYDPNSENGNGFVFARKDSWLVYAAIVRAMETFKFPFDWKHIIRNGG